MRPREIMYGQTGTHIVRPNAGTNKQYLDLARFNNKVADSRNFQHYSFLINTSMK